MIGSSKPLKVHVPRAGIGHGDGYGYITAQRNIYSALVSRGATITRTAPVELVHTSSHLYKRDKDKFSILWTTAETNDIPKSQVDVMNTADMIIASCKHNENVFIKCGVTKPIRVCELGIDTAIWRPTAKLRGGKKFRFYWEGQKSLRKGWDIVAKAFELAFFKSDPVELYLKTSGGEKQQLAVAGENVFLDSRNLSLADLLDLYQRSHVLVFPTRGEATGLSVLQAMACRLLVIAPAVTGLKEVLTDNNSVILPAREVNVNFGVDTTASDVDPDILADKMRFAVRNYWKLTSLMNEARKTILQRHSILSLGNRLSNILLEVI